MTLDEFKSKSEEIKKEILQRNDIINIEGGTMTIYSENLNKYLEEYCCKDVEDLEDTMWHSYGVYVKVLE